MLLVSQRKTHTGMMHNDVCKMLFPLTEPQTLLSDRYMSSHMVYMYTSYKFLQSERCGPVRDTETRRLHVVQSMIILSIFLLADLARVPWITDQRISLHITTSKHSSAATRSQRSVLHSKHWACKIWSIAWYRICSQSSCIRPTTICEFIATSSI